MRTGLTDTIGEWESEGLSNEKEPPITANHDLSTKLRRMNNSRIRKEFKGICLKQDKVTFTPRNVVNLFIVYELDTCSQDLNIDFIQKIVYLELLN